MAETTFKKKRLFKVQRELNVSQSRITEFLDEHGFSDALKGKGLNASIVDEEAYYMLLDEFADDAAAASRVQELRSRRLAEEEPEAVSIGDGQEPAVEEAEEAEPVAEEEAEPVAEAEEDEAVAEEAAPEEVAEPEEAVAEEEAEPVAEEAEEAEAVAEEAAPEAVAEPEEAVAEEEAEPVAEAEEAEVVAEEAAPEEVAEPEEAVAEEEAEPVAEEEAEDVEAAAEEEEPEAELEDEEAEAVADEEEDDEDDLEPESVLSAGRFRLRGAKVVGKVDLGAIQEKTKRKRKRKRKGGDKKEEDKDTVRFKKEASRSKEKKSKKRSSKRKKSFDEEDVEDKLQKTLAELEQGASRIRSRRRRRRRQRLAEEREAQMEREAEESNVLRVTEFISTGELANLMDVEVNDVISTLFDAGMMVSINQRLDADTISIVADEYDFDVEFITDFTEEELVLEEDKPEDLEPRAPVVTVMGHVDHGKTSLLDYVRKENVVAGEAGGITQHIGAYKVELDDGRLVSFLDTPGHEAFTAMRARGARATDVVILVVAADDAVMPQTVEAINHAQAAGVPLVVAINKMDLPEANPQRVMAELAEQNVLVEQYGGKVQCAEVSAETGENIDDLLEKVLLEAELMELKANPNRNANGVIIESRLEKGRGNVATVLVQNGTLRVGDNFVAGIHAGRVRAMFDERDQRMDEAGPSQPALVLGFGGSPEVGDQFIVLDEEGIARDIAQNRQKIHREQQLRQKKHITLDEIGRRIAIGDFQELNLILKADTGGSVGALSDSLQKLSTEEVAVNIIHTGVGGITENDVMLASASDAVIIGFQVRPAGGARHLAEREEIDIRTYSIIYEAVEEVHDALEGLLSPERSEKVVGSVEVRDIFKVPRVGTVAGSYVTEGRVHRNDKVRVVRDGVVIYDGTLGSLKRFKDDVREVQSGYECGLSIENFNDIKVGDEVEAYEIIETKRTLEHV